MSKPSYPKAFLLELNASKAKWCNKIQRVIQGAYIAFQEHNDTLEPSFIDTKHVYIDWERANLEAAQQSNANEVNMPAFAPGSFGAFDFGEDHSVTSLCTRTLPRQQDCIGIPIWGSIYLFD